MLAATRRVANEKLGIAGKRGQKTGGRTSLDDEIDIPATDPARDEELFAAGLRRLIQSFPFAAVTFVCRAAIRGLESDRVDS